MMIKNANSNSDLKPVCDLPLCGKDADWEVEMFGRTEYYCMRHRPGVPEKLMNRIRPA